jgi:hypothetical protein
MGESSVTGQQLLEIALFGNSTPIQHNDAIREVYSGQPVGDHECGPSGCNTLKRLDYQTPGTCVQSGSRLVQYQDGSIPEDRARNGDPLFLAAGQCSASFRDYGLISIGQAPNEFARHSRLWRRRQSAPLALREN